MPTSLLRSFTPRPIKAMLDRLCLLTVPLLFLGTACNSSTTPVDDGSGGGNGSNQAPTAQWTANSLGTVGIEIPLNGQGSFDPDNDDLEFFWELNSRPAFSAAIILNARTDEASLTPDVPGTYVVQLVVSDGPLESPPVIRSIAIGGTQIWQPTYGPAGGVIEDILALPRAGTTDTVWYAGVRTGGSGIGLYRSLNRGASWLRVPDSQTAPLTTDVLSFAANPSTTEDDIFAGTISFGVVRSYTTGENWQAPNVSSLSQVDALHVYPSVNGIAPDRLFAGTSSGGIRYSDNGGESWAATDLTGPAINAITQVPLNPLFFAATTAGIYSSDSNLGVSWTAEAGITGSVSDVHDVPALGTFAVADTVYMRDDASGTWSTFDTGLESATIVSLGSTATGLLLAGATSGDSLSPWMYRWNVGLGTWEPVGENVLSRPDALCFTRDQNVTLCGTSFGVFKSDDDGLNWESVSSTLAATTVRAFSTRVVGPLMVGTDFGAYERTSTGWDSFLNGFIGRRIAAMDEAPNGDYFAGDADVGAVLRSRDAGAVWENVSTGLNPTAGVQCFEFQGASVLVGTTNGIFLSTTGGTTWAQQTSGVPFPVNVRDMTTSPSGRIFAATAANGILALDMGSATWTTLNTLGGTSFASLCSIPGGFGEADTIFAGRVNGPLMRSQDDGQNWGLLAQATTTWNDLVADVDGVLYAATSSGVRKTPDLGSLWETLDLGLVDDNCLSLGFDSSGRLNVGLFAGGVFRLE